MVLTMDSFEDHLKKLEVVLAKLLEAGLRVDAEKSTFWMETIEYLGYLLIHERFWISCRKKGNLALQPPTTLNQLLIILGLVQYYKDICDKRSKVLALFTNLVKEYGHANMAKKKVLRKKVSLGINIPGRIW